MKISNLIRVALAVALTVGVSMPIDAAKKRTGSKTYRTTRTAAAPKVVAGEIHNYGDALTTQEFSVRKGDSGFVIEYPIAGNPELVNNIRDYIKFNVEFFKKVNASIDKPEAFLAAAIKPYSRKGAPFTDCEVLDQTVKVDYINDKVVTVIGNGEWYGGGAHGQTVRIPQSYLLSTGEALTADMFPSINVMRPYILQGLASAGKMTLAEVDEMCFGNSGEIPMGDPFIMADGLHIIYQEYDIAPFAYGLPEAIIPFSKLKGVVSAEVEKFF